MSGTTSASYAWYSRCSGPRSRDRTSSCVSGRFTRSSSLRMAWSNLSVPIGLIHRMRVTCPPSALSSELSERAGGLRPNAYGRVGQVGEGNLLDLDDLDSSRVSPCEHGAAAGRGTDRVDGRRAICGGEPHHGLGLTTDVRERGTNRVRNIVVAWPQDVANSWQRIGHQEGAATYGDDWTHRPSRFDPVDAIRKDRVQLTQRPPELPPPGRCQGRVTENGATCRRGRIRQGCRAAAEDHRGFGNAIPDTVWPKRRRPPVRESKHGAASKSEADEVRHPEVRPDPAELEWRRRLSGETVGYRPYVRRGSSHVYDQAVIESREVRGSSNAVRGPAAGGQDGMVERIVEAHQTAVVLSEEDERLEPVRVEGAAERLGDASGNSPKSGVEHRRVLPLQEADGANFMAQGQVHVAAGHLPHTIGCPQLVLWRDGRKHAHDRDSVDALCDRLHETRDGVLVERRQRATVKLEAATHDDFARRHCDAQVRRPCGQRRHGLGRGRPKANDGNAAQASTLEDRVGRVGRPEHHVGDAVRGHRG